MKPEELERTHPDPVWRDRADFIIGAQIPEAPGHTEQLWTQQKGERLFEICCIPFLLYDVALGDVVETDEAHDYQRVVVPSNRFVFRVWFGDTSATRDPVANALTDKGALLEWSSSDLLAIDAPTIREAQPIADFLQEREQADGLEYETGRR